MHFMEGEGWIQLQTAVVATNPHCPLRSMSVLQCILSDRKTLCFLGCVGSWKSIMWSSLPTISGAICSFGPWLGQYRRDFLLTCDCSLPGWIWFSKACNSAVLGNETLEIRRKCFLIIRLTPTELPASNIAASRNTPRMHLSPWDSRIKQRRELFLKEEKIKS